VRTTLDGDQVVTTVTDRGPGIAPEDRERIFDKFTRLGDHLTRPQQGVGLGLYIARRSIEQLGGRLTCDAAPQGGARFTFRLPVGAGPPAPAARRSSARTTPARPAAARSRARTKAVA
jgi:two-component system sensor histidine kinase KdpD